MDNDLAKDILQMIEHANCIHDEKQQNVHQWIKLVNDIKYLCIGQRMKSYINNSD